MTSLIYVSVMSSSLILSAILLNTVLCLMAILRRACLKSSNESPVWYSTDTCLSLVNVLNMANTSLAGITNGDSWKTNVK